MVRSRRSQRRHSLRRRALARMVRELLSLGARCVAAVVVLRVTAVEACCSQSLGQGLSLTASSLELAVTVSPEAVASTVVGGGDCSFTATIAVLSLSSGRTALPKKSKSCCCCCCSTSRCALRSSVGLFFAELFFLRMCFVPAAGSLFPGFGEARASLSVSVSVMVGAGVTGSSCSDGNSCC